MKKLSSLFVILCVALACTACGSPSTSNTTKTPADTGSASASAKKQENNGTVTMADLENSNSPSEEHSDTDNLNPDTPANEQTPEDTTSDQAAEPEELDADDPSEPEDGESEETSGTLSADSISVTYGDFTVQVMDCKETQDINGCNALRVSYLFTNNSTQKATFSTSVIATAYQGDIRLTITSPSGSDDQYSAQLSFVEPGRSTTCAAYYMLNDDETDVRIEVSNLLDSSDDKLSLLYSFQK